MTDLTGLLSWVLLGSGALFCVVGGLGLLRMPDFWARAHAAGISDTLAAGLILSGLMLQAGFGLVTVKLVMVLAFIYITSPTAGHALYRAAHAHGLAFGADTRLETEQVGEDRGAD